MQYLDSVPGEKVTMSQTFSTSYCMYANYGKLGKPKLQ